ncbi:3914_t:CDS:2, partial [Acaulospora morrowiae]
SKNSCYGKPKFSVMLYGNIKAIIGEELEKWLREVVKLPFKHVIKKPHVGYAHIHFSSHENASNFFYTYKDIIFDGPKGNNVKIKESYCFGRSKVKTTTEENLSQYNNNKTKAITQGEYNGNDRGKAVIQEKGDDYDQPEATIRETVIRERRNNDWVILDNKTDKKRKFDAVIDEEFREDAYYRLLPSCLKLAKQL